MNNNIGDDHAARVAASYERLWGRVNEVLSCIETDREKELARIIRRALLATAGEEPPGERISLFWRREVPAPYTNAINFIRGWIADEVIAATEISAPQAIAELGSGWGYNLFNVWLRGGPRLIPYYAFEYTQAGRQCSDRIAKMATEKPNLEIYAFDYRAPDLSPLHGRFESVLLYTSHSIEQVAALPDSLFDQILGLAPSVTVVHCEPVGWQFREKLNQTEARDYGQRAYCERHGYNMDLWEKLTDLEHAGRIQIDQAQADLMSVKLFNGTSLIRWRKLG